MNSLPSGKGEEGSSTYQYRYSSTMTMKRVSSPSSATTTTTTSQSSPGSSNSNSPASSSFFVIGAEVTTPFGHGRVSCVRSSSSSSGDDPGRTTEEEENQIVVVVLLNSWKLSGKSYVTCYLQSSAVQLYVPKSLAEMTMREKIQYAQSKRREAKAALQSSMKNNNNNYAAALAYNMQAVDAVRALLRGYSRKEIGQQQRASMLVLKIDALLDAATCSLHLDTSCNEAAEMFARRALQLIDTLDDFRDDLTSSSSSSSPPTKKKQPSEQLLCGNIKIFGQWRVRSYVLIATAMIKTKREKEAVYVLNQASDVITQFTTSGEYNNITATSSTTSTSTTSLAVIHKLAKLRAQATTINTLKAECLKLNYVVGAFVDTPYGRGRVKELGDKQMVVILTDWKLASLSPQKNAVLCYLNYDCVSLHVPKTLSEMSLADKIDRARTMKMKGATQFISKNYAASLTSNTKAVDAVRSIIRCGLETSDLKSSLLVLKVGALNEASACSNHLGLHESAEMFSRRALQLTDMLEQTHRYTRFPKVSLLLGDGTDAGDDEQTITEVKLFAEWRVRSYLLIAEALVMTKEEDKALLVLDTANDIIYKNTQEERMNSPVLLAQVSLIKELQNLCKSNKRKRRNRTFRLPKAVIIGRSSNGSCNGNITNAVSAGKVEAANNKRADSKQKKRSIFYGLNPFRKGGGKKTKEEPPPHLQPASSGSDTSSSELPPTTAICYPNPTSEVDDDDELSEEADTVNTLPVENRLEEPVNYQQQQQQQQPTDFSVASLATQKAHGSSKSMFTLQMNLGDGRGNVNVTDAEAIVKQLDEGQRMKARTHLMALQAQLSELQHMIETEPLQTRFEW